MQRIECGLFAPQCLLSVCLPFLAKVHPQASNQGSLFFQKIESNNKEQRPRASNQGIATSFRVQNLAYWWWEVLIYIS